MHIDNIEYIVRPGFIGIGFDAHGVVNEHFEVNTPGKFSAYNAMSAIMVSEIFGVNSEDIKAGLLNTFVKGRVESVKISDRFTLLIDYAHNAMSMESLLTTIREYNPKRIVSLFGCGGNRSKLRRYEMGEISGKYADLSIITADNSRFENVLDIIVLLLGKGHEDYQEIEGVRYPFDERVIIKEILEDLEKEGKKI